MAAHRTLVSVLVVLSLTSASAWKNPRQSASLNTPVFGTHDWIAFKAYELAGRPAFIKNNLNRYFIGTEAPDNGFKPAEAEGTYRDTSPCHCILFDEDGDVTQDRNEVRTRQEFDKAVAALADGNRRLAAFYAGAQGVVTRATKLGARIVTTEKDQVRFPPGFAAWTLRMSVEVLEGERLLQSLLSRIVGGEFDVT